MDTSKSLVVVGVSEQSSKYGHKIFVDLLKAGYTVAGVNPKGGTVAGKRLYTSLAEVTPYPEIVIIVVPPKIGIRILEECSELSITNVWMQPGSESRAAIVRAQQLGIHLTTACFMIHEGIW